MGTLQERMQVTSLTAGEQKILSSLAELHFATNDQLTRHAWGRSYEYVCGLTRRLVARGQLGTDFERRKMQMGKSRSIFFLSAKAHRDFSGQGYVLPVMHPVREHLQSHLLGVGDLLLTVRDYERTAGIVVERLLHDLVMKKDPIIVPVEGRARAFVPDLWCELGVSGKSWRIAFELDRGSEAEPKWRDKVRLLVGFAKSGARERFGVDTVTIATVIAPEEARTARRRLADLIRWTEKELTELRAEPWGVVFLFRIADPRTIDPLSFFTEPAWIAPFDATPTSLIIT